ncbi:MAG: hypothetical protein C4308_08560 [Chitinophagaceae bacterium]
MFWGMSHVDFKKYMDELGMTIVASHCDINQNFEKKIEDAAAIGMKYLICPSVDAQATADDYKKLAEQFNHCGEVCKKAGLRFAYHNHNHDFKTINDLVPLEIFLQNTNAELVDFEMDIYWVVTASYFSFIHGNKRLDRGFATNACRQ